MKNVILILLLMILDSCNSQNRQIIEKEASAAIQPKKAEGRMVYFSMDNGDTWEDKSNGLPENVGLTDIAVSNELLGAITKQNGVFLYNFKENRWANTEARPQTSSNLDALILHDGKVVVGSENAGVFISADGGKSWRTLNQGIGNLTVRKFAEIDHKLYVGTNGGLYSLNENEHKWTFEYGHSSLQVNGIAEFQDEIYIGTNHGAYKSRREQKEWRQIMENCSLHNISSDYRMVYAMTYDELFSSSDKGNTWQSLQKGLPAQLYSFQLLEKDNTIFVGQWDGVYKKLTSSGWVFSSTGLPSKFAVTEMKIYKDMLVIGCAESKLRKGVNTEK